MRHALAAVVLLSTACGGGGSSGSYGPTDREAPFVTIVSPAPGAVDGVVTIATEATDNDRVAFVRFRVNGGLLAEADSSYPFAYVWNTATYSPGLYEWQAIATDRAGNTSTSGGVAYTFSSIR